MDYSLLLVIEFLDSPILKKDAQKASIFKSDFVPDKNLEDQDKKRGLTIS